MAAPTKETAQHVQQIHVTMADAKRAILQIAWVHASRTLCTQIGQAMDIVMMDRTSHPITATADLQELQFG